MCILYSGTDMRSRRLPALHGLLTTTGLTGVSKTIVPTEQEEDNTPATAQKDTESVNTAPQQEKLLAEAKTKPAATAKTAPKRPIVVESATNDSEITFKIQILTSSKPLAKNDKRLKGLKEVDYYKEGGIYKYTYGASSDYNKVLRTKRTITAQFKDAFIIAFRNGEKIDCTTARVSKGLSKSTFNMAFAISLGSCF